MIYYIAQLVFISIGNESLNISLYDGDNFDVTLQKKCNTTHKSCTPNCPFKIYTHYAHRIFILKNWILFRSDTIENGAFFNDYTSTLYT